MQTAVTPPKSWYSVVFVETRCVLRTVGMLARKSIWMPVSNVGRVVIFADGTRSEVYRETRVRPGQSNDLVLLAVRFRLRLIGASRVWHFLFRVESLLNTFLFAAHRGFQTKLWLRDRTTAYYRGIYEWQGRAAAVEYLETLRVVLAPWVQTGSFAYEVIEGVSRDDYLHGFQPPAKSSARDWWRPVASAPAPGHTRG